MPPRAPALLLELVASETFSYAHAHAGIPVVHSARITNLEARAVSGLKLEVELPGDFAEPLRRELPRLAGNATLTLPALQPRLDHRRLRELLDPRAARLEARVLDSQGGMVAQAGQPLQVLAADEWDPRRGLPELLAAFVSPQDPTVQDLLQRAGGPLEGARLASQQETLGRVIAALAELRITTAVPASGAAPRKIRLPDPLLRYRMGSQLDLALLTAGALEAAGLSPLVVLAGGHAIAACHLGDSQGDEVVRDDLAGLCEAAREGRVALIDLAAITGRDTLPQAQQRAIAALREAAEGPCFAIDIRVARREGILPLPRPDEAPSGRHEMLGELGEESLGVPSEAASGKHARPGERLTTWRAELAEQDPARSPLLDLAATESIPLRVDDLPAFEDALAARDRFVLEARADEDSAADRLQDLARGCLRTGLEAEELAARALRLERAAARDLAQRGRSRLAVGIGLVRWQEAGQEEGAARYAPVLIAPARVERGAEGAITLTAGEGEPRLNEALLERLERRGVTVRELRRMPLDDHGADLAKVFERLRQTIAGEARWELVERAVIARLPLARQLLHGDLAALGEELAEHPLAGRLLSPREADPALDALTAEALNARPAPGVLCADASQRAALEAGLAGRSFVLEGAPGTGKTQVLANLVASALSRGQTALVVSSKAAALDDLRARLGELASFALPLYGREGSQREVIGRLAALLEADAPVAPARVEESETRAERRREALADVVARLHERHPLGLSLADALARLAALEQAPRLERLGGERLLQVTDGQLQARLRAINGLAEAARGLSGLGARHALRACRISEWTPLVEQDLRRRLDDLDRSLDRLEELAHQAAEAIPAVEAAPALGWLQALPPLCELLARSPRPPQPLIARRAEAHEREIREAQARDERRRRLLAELGERWDQQLLQLDLNALIADLRQNREAFVMVRWWRLGSTRKQLQAVCRQPRLPEIDLLIEDLIAAREAVELERRLAEQRLELTSLLGRLYAEGETDWAEVERLLSWCGSFREALDALDQRTEAPVDRSFFLTLAAEARPAEQARLQALGAPLEAALSSFERRFQELAQALEADAEAVAVIVGRPLAEAPLPRLASALGALREALPRLRAWARFMAARKGAEGAGVEAAFLEAAAGGELPPAQLSEAYQRSFLDRWVHHLIDADRVLASFEGRAQSRAVERFVEAESELLKQRALALTAKLTEGLPRASEARAGAATSSELGILLREAKARSRHLPLRRLFAKIPRLLLRLQPCILTSPEALPEMLPASGPRFDLVLFDEASQLSAAEALSAVGRGAQVIIAGDSEQLPPETGESLLKAAARAGLPRLSLQTHYRSRSEELFALSHARVYGGGLTMLPSPPCASHGLRRNLTPRGRLDRRQGHNRGEAVALVRWVLRRLCREPRRSLGVVALTAAQRDLILALLDEARAACPALDPVFSSAAEPVRVGTAEEWQGEVRDVIALSLVYGRDEEGRLPLEFGPLTDGRAKARLNVALTRAREELRVFTALDGRDLDLTRSRRPGFALVSDLLRVAAGGPEVLGEAWPETPAAGSSLAAPLGRYLESRGWPCSRPHGLSRGRLALAARDPQDPARLLLGIETDCAADAESPVADRFWLRPRLLRERGWKLSRLWSLDWFFQGREAFDDILHRLRQGQRDGLAVALCETNGELPERLEGPPEMPWDELEIELAEEPEDERHALLEAPTEFIREPEPRTPEPPAEDEVEPEAEAPEEAEAPDEPDADEDDEADEADEDEVELGSEEEPEDAPTAEPEEEPDEALTVSEEAAPAEEVAPASEAAPAELEAPRVYEMCAGGPPVGRPRDFDADLAGVQGLIREVLAVEAPLHLRDLAERIAPRYRIARVVARVRERIARAAAAEPLSAELQRRGDVFWRADQDPSRVELVRGQDASGLARKPDRIPPEEAQAAIRQALDALGPQAEDEVLREAARRLGYQRLSKKVRKLLDGALEQLIVPGELWRDGELLRPGDV